jgi:hypothetical protein
MTAEKFEMIRWPRYLVEPQYIEGHYEGSGRSNLALFISGRTIPSVCILIAPRALIPALQFHLILCRIQNNQFENNVRALNIFRDHVHNRAKLVLKSVQRG